MSRKIKVIAVGPAAGRIMNKIITDGVEHTEFIHIDTDPQALQQSLAGKKIFLEAHLKQYPVDTSYLVPANKERMAELRKQDEVRFDESCDALRDAIVVSKQDIKEVMAGADLIIIICCMGSIKGLVIAPEMASIASEMNIPSAAILSKPYKTRGNTTMSYYQKGMDKIKQYTEAVKIIDMDGISYENWKKPPKECLEIANNEMGKALKRMVISAQTC
jgi:cell division protein FtsZ